LFVAKVINYCLICKCFFEKNEIKDYLFHFQRERF
jgi:hypothetical protein